MTTEYEKLKLLGKNIAKYRKHCGYSQNRLAEILDVTREHIAKIETAQRGISINLLFRIADALNISESDLLKFE